MSIVKPLYGHTSAETSYLIESYPYGRVLRCKMKCWVEFDPKKGYRFVSQTSDPKVSIERWNKEKKGTYALLAMNLFLDEEGHVQHTALSEYSSATEILAFLKNFPETPVSEKLKVFVIGRLILAKRTNRGEANISIGGKPCLPSELDVAESLSEMARLMEALNILKERFPTMFQDMTK